MKSFKFEWRTMNYALPVFITTLTVVEENVGLAERKLANVFNMSLPMMRRFLSHGGYQLSVTEVVQMTDDVNSPRTVLKQNNNSTQ